MGPYVVLNLSNYTDRKLPADLFRLSRAETTFTTQKAPIDATAFLDEARSSIAPIEISKRVTQHGGNPLN